jgi:hypothetical protein
MNEQSMDKSITSNLAPELVQAYRETHYRVTTDSADLEAFALLVDETSKPLAGLHKKFGVDCSAYFTACNPLSQSLPEDVNSSRMEKLKQVLRARSLRGLEGVGLHPSNQWPGEPSVLILGLSLSAAKVLAEDFEQNAFVWSGAEARSQLVLLRQ